MLYLASDHAGFKAKQEIKEFLKENEIEYLDLGAYEYDKEDDYPDFGFRLALKVATEPDTKGILICGSGQGISITANKVKGIIAAVVWDGKSARHAKEHLNSNVLALPGDIMSPSELVEIWLNQKVDLDGRHKRRLEKIKDIEDETMRSISNEDEEI